MPCPIPMPAPVGEVSAAPASPTMSSSFSLRNYPPPPTMPGEMVFPMTPATSQPPPPPTAPFMQQAAPLCGGGGEGSASDSGGSGASAGPAALPHGTQLLAEQLLHRQRVYEAALGLDPSEGISDSIQQGGSDDSKRDYESGGPLQGDDGDVRVGHGRNRHLATTQLEFLTAAAEECRC